MENGYAVHKILNNTLLPALLLDPMLNQPVPDVTANRRNALVAHLITQAPKAADPVAVAVMCIKAVYRDAAIDYTNESVNEEVRQAVRHGQPGFDHAPFHLATVKDVQHFTARGWTSTQLILDAQDLKFLLEGGTLGDFTDEQASHLIILTPEAKEWLRWHRDENGRYA